MLALLMMINMCAGVSGFNNRYDNHIASMESTQSKQPSIARMKQHYLLTATRGDEISQQKNSPILEVDHSAFLQPLQWTRVLSVAAGQSVLIIASLALAWVLFEGTLWMYLEAAPLKCRNCGLACLPRYPCSAWAGRAMLLRLLTVPNLPSRQFWRPEKAKE
mmetsp:Transcript_80105/g.159852  ORF Transcript_80105/g.159852 Transcript_80105/m.159852 type:complete len:162 (-) Transcript_80105:810-1295(-)